LEKKSILVEKEVWKTLHMLRLRWNMKTINDVVKRMVEEVKDEDRDR